MDLLNILSSTSFDVADVAVCDPGTSPSENGEADKQDQMKNGIGEEDVEAQTPLNANNTTHTPSLTAGDSSIANETTVFDFSIAGNINLDDAPPPASANPFDDDLTHEPIYRIPTDSTRTVIPPSWPFGPLPNMPAIPFVSSPPVDLHSLPSVSSDSQTSQVEDGIGGVDSFGVPVAVTEGQLLPIPIAAPVSIPAAAPNARSIPTNTNISTIPIEKRGMSPPPPDPPTAPAPAPATAPAPVPAPAATQAPPPPPPQAFPPAQPSTPITSKISDKPLNAAQIAQSPSPLTSNGTDASLNTNAASIRTVHVSNSTDLSRSQSNDIGQSQHQSQSQHSMAISQHSKSQKVALFPNRQNSVALFAKPSVSRDFYMEEEEMVDADRDWNNDKKVTIHHSKDGENSEFEIDYEADSVHSNKIDPQNPGGFVDGNFSSGILRQINTAGNCFQLKFNLDSTLLAVGLSDGKGLELYETTQFRLIYTIERADTVSALDWVEADDPSMRGIKRDKYMDSRYPKAQLLAVGGFDGFVKVYSINLVAPDISEMVLLIDSFHVKSEICCVSFLKDSATNYSPSPRVIAIGEKNGQISTVALNNIESVDENAIRIRPLQMAESAVLSISFGFIREGIIIVYGTKDGRCRVSVLNEDQGDWRILYQIFEVERTGAIRALRFNHDSSLLIVGGYDKTVLIIDTILWKVMRELYMDGTVQTIEYDPFNRFLLIGSRSKVMTVIDTSTLHPIKRFYTDGWVTSISWGGQSTIAMRSDDKQISLIMFEPIQTLGMTLTSSRGEDCSISWSADGRFLAHTQDNDVIICDSKKDFDTIAKVSDVVEIKESDTCRCVRFCHSEGKQDRLAFVGKDGYLTIMSLRISVGKIFQQVVATKFIEKNLKSVAWSPDGNTIATGGREMKLHFIDSSTLHDICDPLHIGSRIWTIDSLSEKAYIETGDYASSFAFALTAGRNICTVLDLETMDVSMEITRKRTVRCQKYHPCLPVLAVGDGGNEVIIVDLVGERKIASFMVDGRVNSIAFSPLGDYIGIGSDEGTFTIHDTTNFKCVQEIRSPSISMSIEFSGASGQFLAISHANGDVKIIKLGPLLSIDYTPLEKILDLPQWAKEEITYRSPEGPSLLQRCMLDGSKESLVCAGSLLEETPESVLTFDRTTGVGCFETAVELGKPNIMTLILTPVVDGTLDSRSAWSSTTMPLDGFLTLRDLILNHPPGFATDILCKMTFMKVPFAAPRRCHVNDLKECGSATFTDPWGEETVHLIQKQASKLNGGFESDSKDKITLIPAVLPLPGLGKLDFLSALLSMSNVGPGVFDNDAMGLILIVLWKGGIRKYFVADFLLNLVFSTCWVNLVDRTASTTAITSNDGTITTILAWSVVSMNVVFALKQGIRFVTKRGHFFRSSWHIVEVTCIILVFVYSILVFIHDDHDDSLVYVSTSGGKGNVPLAVATTFLLTIKFVSVLRGFDTTGYLVAVLVQNFLDVRGFIIVIISILLGFTVIFRLLLADVPGECKVLIEDENILSNDCDGNPFGTLPRSILSTFELTIMGSYENGILYDAKETILVSIVFIIAVTVILVVALNALIAVLGDSFSRVQENVVATRQRERAELCVEYLSMMTNNQRKNIEENNQYFHALLASDGHGDLLHQRHDWNGGINALKKELTEITEANNVATQRSIDQLRIELSEEISAMLQNEVTSVLNNVFIEMKEMSKFRQASIRTRKAANAAQAAQTMGGTRTPFDGIRRNHFTTRDDRSATTSMDEHGNMVGTLVSV